MKKIIQKTGAILLTLLVLFSSVSFTIEKHMCGGQIFSKSFIGKAENCGMDTDYCKVENKNHAVSKKSCCKDEIQFINGLTFKKKLPVKLKNKQHYFVSFNTTHSNFVSKTENRLTQLKYYYPPPIVKKITVLYQVFRI